MVDANNIQVELVRRTQSVATPRTRAPLLITTLLLAAAACTQPMKLSRDDSPTIPVNARSQVVSCVTPF